MATVSSHVLATSTATVSTVSNSVMGRGNHGHLSDSRSAHLMTAEIRI